VTVRAREVPIPVSMAEAVGYAALDCAQERAGERALVLKQDRLFLLVDGHGEIAPPGRCGLGLFLDDTRILSHYALRFAGGPPSLLSAQVRRMYQAQIDLAVSDQAFGGDSWDPKNCVHIQRRLLLDGSLVERVSLANYLTVPIDYWVELDLGCDFADIFEVRGWRREARGQFYAPEPGDSSLAFAYRGRDGAVVRSVVRFAGPPTEVHPGGARWRLRLEASGVRELEWEVRGDFPGAGRSRASGGDPDARAARLEASYARWADECAS
jgi:glycogen debranching enzyme